MTNNSMSFSSNHFKNWQRCPKKYQLDTLENLQWPTDPKGFQLGLAVHQLMDWQANNLPLEIAKQKMPADIISVFEKLNTSVWGQLTVLKSEWPFMIALENNLWVEGRIDRLAVGKIEGYTPHVWILDWKTGTAIPKDPVYDWQTQIYALAVLTLQHELGLHISPNELGFAYVQANTQSEGTEVAVVEFEDSYIQQSKTLIIKTANKMATANTFELPEQCPDAYCPYNPVCGIREKTLTQ